MSSVTIESSIAVIGKLCSSNGSVLNYGRYETSTQIIRSKRTHVKQIPRIVSGMGNYFKHAPKWRMTRGLIFKKNTLDSARPEDSPQKEHWMVRGKKTHFEKVLRMMEDKGTHFKMHNYSKITKCFRLTRLMRYANICHKNHLSRWPESISLKINRDCTLPLNYFPANH